LLKAGGVEDHIHILTRLSPTIAISDTLRFIKSNTSKWINERPDVPGKFEWQTGFAAFSVSESNVDAVVKYISNQKEHHKTMTFKDEFIALLQRHQIEFDDRYVFENEIVS
jgi:putative transposase